MKNKVEFTINEDKKEKSITVELEGNNVNVEHLLIVGKTTLEGAVDMLIQNAKETGVYKQLEDEIKSSILEDIKDLYEHMKEYIENK